MTRELTKPMMSDESNAPEKLMETLGKNLMARATMAVLTIRVKTPRVKIMSGKASVVTSGLTKELISEKIRPATTKSEKS